MGAVRINVDEDDGDSPSDNVLEHGFGRDGPESRNSNRGKIQGKNHEEF